MKTPVFACFAALATVAVAEPQGDEVAAVPAAVDETVAVETAVDEPVTAEAAASGIIAGDDEVIDEIFLEDEEDEGKVVLTPVGEGGAETQMVDIVCEDATISEVLRQFRKMLRANIISGETENLSKRVSLSLYATPWREALTVVLDMGGFDLEERNGIFVVTEEMVEDPIIRTKSFKLNHAGAEDLAALINESFGMRDEKTGKVINSVATVFKDANVVVITGNDKLIRDCEEVIKSIDKAPPQVYIEARFMSLSAEAMHKLGVQWNQLESWGATLRGLNAGYERNHGRNANYGEQLTQRTVNNNNTHTTTSNDSESQQPGSSMISDSGAAVSSEGGVSTQKSLNDTDTQTLSDNSTFTTLTPSAIAEAIGAGRSAEQMGWAAAGGFSGQLSVDDFRLALSAFEQFGEGKMFSNPRIIVSNGKRAKVDMTTKHPNVTVTAHRSDGGINTALDLSTRIEVIPGQDKEMFANEAFFSWGITLSVTPRISPDGLINVEIIPTISDLNGWTQVEGVNIEGNNGTPYTKYPIIDVKRLTTDFTMRDGATAVIGGLSQTKEEDVDSGIPYLRKIPWIGPKIFGWKSREKVQNEIIVFVTVGIANPDSLPKDVGLPKNAILGRDYVRGVKLEPGDREGTSAEIMALDMRTLDEQRAALDKEQKDKGDENGDEDGSESPIKSESSVSEEEAMPEDPADAQGPSKNDESGATGELSVVGEGPVKVANL